MFSICECRNVDRHCCHRQPHKPKCIYVCVKCVQCLYLKYIIWFNHVSVGCRIFYRITALLLVVDAYMSVYRILWCPCLEAFAMLWLFVCWHHRQPNVNVIIKHQTDFLSFYSFPSFHMANGKMSKTEFVKGKKKKKNKKSHPCIYYETTSETLFVAQICDQKIVKINRTLNERNDDTTVHMNGGKYLGKRRIYGNPYETE